MDKDDYPILFTGILIGLALGCIWGKLNSIERQITQNPYGKHITTSYDEAGRLVDYLEMPVESELGAGISYHGFQNLTQTESGRIES